MKQPRVTYGDLPPVRWPVAPTDAVLTCAMDDACTAPVTHMDRSGNIYCTAHGLWRRGYEPCRKLQPHEVNRLRNGLPLSKY